MFCVRESGSVSHGFICLKTPLDYGGLGCPRQVYFLLQNCYCSLAAALQLLWLPFLHDHKPNVGQGTTATWDLGETHIQESAEFWQPLKLLANLQRSYSLWGFRYPDPCFSVVILVSLTFPNLPLHRANSTPFNMILTQNVREFSSEYREDWAPWGFLTFDVCLHPLVSVSFLFPLL